MHMQHAHFEGRKAISLKAFLRQAHGYSFHISFDLKRSSEQQIFSLVFTTPFLLSLIK